MEKITYYRALGESRRARLIAIKEGVFEMEKR